MRPTQPDLFEALSRRHDPPTSHAAADTVTPLLPSLEGRVLRALRDAGNRGLTLDELIGITGLQKVTVSPRLRPLVNKGLVAETTDTRMGKSGRQQVVWRAK